MCTCVCDCLWVSVCVCVFNNTNEKDLYRAPHVYTSTQFLNTNKRPIADGFFSILSLSFLNSFGIDARGSGAVNQQLHLCYEVCMKI